MLHVNTLYGKNLLVSYSGKKENFKTCTWQKKSSKCLIPMLSEITINFIEFTILSSINKFDRLARKGKVEHWVRYIVQANLFLKFLLVCQVELIQ